MERISNPSVSALEESANSLENGESELLNGLDLIEDYLEMRAHARAHARGTVSSPPPKPNEDDAGGDGSEPGISGRMIVLGGESIGWSPCHIGDKTELGRNISVGCLTHIGRAVRIGDRTRIQGGAYIADLCVIGEDVFIGPNATLLNDRYPPSGDSKFWQPVNVEANVVIGGGVTILPGVTIGMAAVIAAGAVVTHDVPSAEVWSGVPASKIMTRAEYNQRGSDYRKEE